MTSKKVRSNPDEDTQMNDIHEEEDRNAFLNLLNESDFGTYVRTVNPEEPKTVTPKPVVSNYCVIFPATGKYTCSICFSTNECSRDVEKAMKDTLAHNTKCAGLDPKNDCLACRVRLSSDQRRDHMLSKGHTERIKFIRSKWTNEDDFAFYYTDKGSGQSKPTDNTPFLKMPWTARKETCEAMISTAFEKSEVYFHKITKSMAASKDKNVAILTQSSDVVNLLDTLCMFSTIGVFPCVRCNNEAEIDPTAILEAVKQGVPDEKKRKFFETKNSKASCQLCKAPLVGFSDSMVVAATCKAMKKTILTAVQAVETAKKN